MPRSGKAPGTRSEGPEERKTRQGRFPYRDQKTRNEESGVRTSGGTGRVLYTQKGLIGEGGTWKRMPELGRGGQQRVQFCGVRSAEESGR